MIQHMLAGLGDRTDHEHVGVIAALTYETRKISAFHLKNNRYVCQGTDD